MAFSHSAGVGGSEQVLLQLLRELERDQGVRCAVVVPQEGPLVDHLESIGVAVWIWPTSWWCSAQLPSATRIQQLLSSSTAEILRRLPEIETFDPHAILSITTVSPWGALAAWLLGKPHLWYVTDFGGRADYPLTYFLPFEEVRQSIISSADALLVVSDAVRKRLFHDAEPPPRIVPPHLEPAPTPCRLEEGSSESEPTRRRPRLGVFGNVRDTKGQWVAVQAIADLAHRGVDAELVVVGLVEPSGSTITGLAEDLGVQDRLRVLGRVDDQLAVMATCDVVLVPSLEETFSLVALEAQLLGKPVVASRVGGIVEFVLDGVTGLTVPPAEPVAVAGAVERLLADPALANRLVRSARREAQERFSADGFSGEVRRVLDQILSTQPRHKPLHGALLAPLTALTSQLHALSSQLRSERRTRERAESLSAELGLELEVERQRREESREEALRQADDLARVRSTRGFRLLQAYWRLVSRWRKDPS